jgi:uncharacterized protein
MRIILKILLIILPLCTMAQDFPERSERFVNDYAGVLNEQELADLEALVIAYDHETSVQIAMAIMTTLDGYPVKEYADQLGEKWGVGQGETDNGIVLVVSMEERKMSIATGYGVEAVLPDALCKRIIQNEITPEFKESRYFSGLKAGADAMILATKEEYQDQGGGAQNNEGGAKSNKEGSILPFILISLILIFVFGYKLLEARRYSRMNHVGFWAAWALMNPSSGSSGGSWSSFSGGSGGFSGGSSFGGGSFGGGGASGSW